MQNFWKEPVALRLALIALCCILGIALVISGWKMTGQLAGLGIMLAGIVALLAAMFIYNAPFED